METRVAVGGLILFAVAVLTTAIYFGRLQSLAYLSVDHCILSGLDRISLADGFTIDTDEPDPDERQTFDFDGSVQGGIRASLVGDGDRCKVSPSVGAWYTNGSGFPTGWTIGDKWPVGGADRPPWLLHEYLGDTKSVAFIYPAGSPRQGDIIAVSKHDGATSYAEYREALTMPFGLDALLQYVAQVLVLVFVLASLVLMVMHVNGYVGEQEQE